MFKFATTYVELTGITAQAIRLKINVSIGAKINKNLLELEGSKFSLVKSFKTSAKLCNIPNGPTTLGPFLNWTAPRTFLSR